MTDEEIEEFLRTRGWLVEIRNNFYFIYSADNKLMGVGHSLHDAVKDAIVTWE